MRIKFALVEVGENEALVTLETDEWIVAIPATLADPNVIIDTDELGEVEMKRTSAEWQKLKPYPEVYDPDGWDRANFQYSWHEELVTEGEYEQRTMRSTCMHRVSDFKAAEDEPLG